MGAVAGLTNYILTPEEIADLEGLASLNTFLGRRSTIVLPDFMSFTVTGLRGEIFELLHHRKARTAPNIKLQRGLAIGVAFSSEKMSHVAARSAKAFAKAVPATIGVTAARTLTIPLAPFFKRGLVTGNPLAAIEAPMRMANMKSDRQVTFQVYGVTSWDHPAEVFYYDTDTINLVDVFDGLRDEGLMREGPTAWREGHHPSRGFKLKFRHRKTPGGTVGF